MNFNVHIVTPMGTFWEGERAVLTLPLADGIIQFLANHQEELTMVTDGTAYMTMPNGDKVEFCTSGGVMYFDGKEAYLTAQHVAYQKDWDEKLEARRDYLKQEQKRRKQSNREHMLSTIALNKAFVSMHHPVKIQEE